MIEKGCANLARHIAIAGKFGMPVVVAVNRFHTDTDAEIELVKQRAEEAGAYATATSDHWANGGDAVR